jgi:hypothetical protein
MEQTEGEPSNLPASSAEGKNEQKFGAKIFLLSFSSIPPRAYVICYVNA